MSQNRVIAVLRQQQEALQLALDHQRAAISLLLDADATDEKPQASERAVKSFQSLQTFQASFSAVSKPMLASKY